MAISPEYAAGFFDGEGCVSITITGKNRQTKLRVMVVNTDPRILETFRLTFGGCLSKPRTLGKGWKAFRVLTFNGDEAEAFLLKIKPFSLIKIKQINLALEFKAFMRSPKRERCLFIPSPSERMPNKIICVRKPETLTKELAFKNGMHKLNKRGK